MAVSIYKITADGDLAKDFGLKDQLRRAAISIPSNLAEGDERDTDKDAVRFFYIAKGSIAELRTQLQIAFEICYNGKNCVLVNLRDKHIIRGGQPCRDQKRTTSLRESWNPLG